MWQTFSFNAPQIRFGMDTIDFLGKQVKRLGGKNTLIITGPSVQKTGVLARALALLDEQKIKHNVYIAPRSQVEPTSKDADTTADVIKNGRFDSVVGIGGGSVMDTAKLAVALLDHPGSAREYFSEKRLLKRSMPMIMIPTTSGTSSEITPYSVLVDETDGFKKSAVALCLLPDVAIIDPRLTVSVPQAVTATTGMDAFIHALEAYTAKTANSMCDVLALESMRIIARWLGPAFADGSNLEARYQMALGTMYAGIGLCNVGTHIVHSMSEIFSAEENVTHGDSLSAILLACMESMYVALPEKVFAIGQALGQPMQGLSLQEGAQVTLNALADFIESVELPASLKDLGIKEDAGKIEAWAEASFRDLQHLNTAPRNYSAQNLQKVFQRAFATCSCC